MWSSWTEKRINYSKPSRIPLDVWFELLTLVPVKTLLVFQVVCKSFLSITTDPTFVSLHLRRFPGNRRKSGRPLTLRPSLSRFQVHDTNPQNVSPIITGHIALNPNDITNTKEWPRKWSLAGSLDGLLLLIWTPKDLKGPRTVVLWNPSIRKHRHLPSFPSKKAANLRHAGLGYHNNDYKVIAMACTEDIAWVYSVKTRSWTKIANTGFRKRSTYKSRYSQSFSSSKSGVFWIEDQDLVCFDFATQRFRYVEIPPLLVEFRSDSPWAYMGLVVLHGGSSVGVFGADGNGFKQGVWALETDTDTLSWSPRYKLKWDIWPWRVGGDRILRLEQRDGEWVVKYWMEEDNLFRVVSYDSETLAIKRQHRYMGLRADYMGDYFESLIMP